MFWALTSEPVGEIGFLLQGDVGLLLLGEEVVVLLLVEEVVVLVGFLWPTLPLCLRVSISSWAKACISAALWALFCCSSYNTAGGGDIRQAGSRRKRPGN